MDRPETRRTLHSRAFRSLLRTAIILCLAAAIVSLLALAGEYPGSTAAGRRVLARDVLSLALIAWINLGALEAVKSPAPRRGWIGVAVLIDVVMLVVTVPSARHGGPPLTLALPLIAALLLIGVLGLAFQLTGKRDSAGRRR